MAGRPRSGRGQGVRFDRWVKTDEINSNIILYTLTTISALFVGFWPGSEASEISGHFGFHVNVVKKSGGPYTLQIAIPS